MNNDKKNYNDLYSKIEGYGLNIPKQQIFVIFILSILIIIFINIFSNSEIDKSPYNVGNTPVNNENETSIFGILITSGIVFYILILGLKYLFNINIYTELKNIYTNKPEIDLNIDTHDNNHKHKHHKHKHHKHKNQKIDYPILSSPEVFHISDNKYTYDNARAVCKAFNSRLASYDEVEEAYNNGGEWCSYGWSKNGLALFPTQKSTYNKLQKIKNYQNVCGRTGVNGGYIKNKNMKFGVNCFGIKPSINKIERALMKDYKVYPKTKDEQKINKRAKKYRKKLGDILITPFNKNKWSE